MSLITITDPVSGSTAAIAAHRGFNCCSFVSRFDGREVDVIASKPDFPETGERPSGNGSPILFPFPNRIAHGRFQWEGKEYRVPLRPGTDHAIHGFVYDRPWRVTDQKADAVTGEFQFSRDDPDRAPCWPADGKIEVAYRLHRNVLRMNITISNPDKRPLPWGFGTHTYFKIPPVAGSPPSSCIVRAPAHEMWLLNEMIPTGQRLAVPPEADLRDGRRFTELDLDHALTGLRSEGKTLEVSLMDETAGVEVVQQCDSVFRELVAFTPSFASAVCLEPYTCMTDAINLHAKGIDTGLRILRPKESFKTWIQIAARPILA